MAVRPATASDQEALAQILIASSDDDPCYGYRFPLKHEYASQYGDHCRRKISEYLDTNTVVVYEITAPDGAKKVIAFSVWDEPKLRRRPKAERSQTWPRWGVLLPFRTGTTTTTTNANSPDPQNGPANTAAPNSPRPNPLHRSPSLPKPFAREDRASAFRDASKAAKARFFGVDGGGYMYLKVLLCHPAHRRRGAGSALVRWGVARALVLGVDTALFSSPMGLPLYRKLRFREVGRFEVRVCGEKEFLDIPAMVFRPPGRERRGNRCAVEVGPGGGLRKCVTHNVVVGKV